MTDQVFVIGDSWGKCSWKYIDTNDKLNKHDEPSTLTFESLWKKHNIEVTNLSVIASSNNDSLQTLVNNLDQLQQAKHIVVFQTDPIRDIYPALTRDKKFVTEWNKAILFESLDKINCTKTENFNQLIDFLLIRFYTELKKLSSIKDKIILVSGLSQLNPSMIQELDHIKRSIMEWLLPNYSDTYFRYSKNVFFVNEVLTNHWSWNRAESMENILSIERKILIKNWHWQNSDFFTCGHLSDRGFTIVSDILLNYIKTKEII